MSESKVRRYLREQGLLPRLRSDEIFYAHMNDPGFVEGIIKFFNDIDTRHQQALNKPTPLFPPTDYKW